MFFFKNIDLYQPWLKPTTKREERIPDAVWRRPFCCVVLAEALTWKSRLAERMSLWSFDFICAFQKTNQVVTTKNCDDIGDVLPMSRPLNVGSEQN